MKLSKNIFIIVILLCFCMIFSTNVIYAEIVKSEDLLNSMVYDIEGNTKNFTSVNETVYLEGYSFVQQNSGVIDEFLYKVQTNTRYSELSKWLIGDGKKPNITAYKLGMIFSTIDYENRMWDGYELNYDTFMKDLMNPDLCDYTDGNLVGEDFHNNYADMNLTEDYQEIFNTGCNGQNGTDICEELWTALTNRKPEENVTTDLNGYIWEDSIASQIDYKMDRKVQLKKPDGTPLQIKDLAGKDISGEKVTFSKGMTKQQVANSFKEYSDFLDFCEENNFGEACKDIFDKNGILTQDITAALNFNELVGKIDKDVIKPNQEVHGNKEIDMVANETLNNPTGTPTDFSYNSATSGIIDGKEGIFSLANLTKRVNKLIEKGENETLVKSIKDILVGSEDDSIGGLIGKIGRYIMYACILFFGVKAIWGGVEGKSHFKEVLPYLLAGIVFFFCAEILIKVATNSFSGGQQYEGDGVVSGKVNYDDYGKSLFATIVLLVRMLAFGGIMFTGVKLLFATAEQRASIKSHLIPILVGCLFVFASSFIVDIVVKSVKESTGSIGIYEKYELARYDNKIIGGD